MIQRVRDYQRDPMRVFIHNLCRYAAVWELHSNKPVFFSQAPGVEGLFSFFYEEAGKQKTLFEARLYADGTMQLFKRLPGELGYHGQYSGAFEDTLMHNLYLQLENDDR